MHGLFPRMLQSSVANVTKKSAVVWQSHWQLKAKQLSVTIVGETRVQQVAAAMKTFFTDGEVLDESTQEESPGKKAHNQRTLQWMNQAPPHVGRHSQTL